MNKSLNYLLIVILAVGVNLISPLVHAQNVSTTSANTSENTIVLNPFEVTQDADDSYGALNSNSITRFKTELDKLPVSADIFDQAFIKDVAATTIEQMLMQYSAGAGNASLDQTTGAGSQPGDHVSHKFMQLRGFNTTSIQRDGLMSLGLFYNPGGTLPGTTSNFDVDRVEVINGPQALLYAGGGAGGVISTVSKQARFNSPMGGSTDFKIDNYGSKIGQFDLGFGTNKFALRFAATAQSVQTRRINIGTKMDGQYLQIAFKPFKNTTIRVIGEQTFSNHINPATLTLAAGSSTNDSRQSYNLKYLMSQNMLGATASSPNTQGAILNGLLNWSNVDSLQGWGNSEKGTSTYESINIETKWNSWLSSQFSAGYNNYHYDLISTQSTSLYTPGDNTTGQWAVASSPIDTWEPARNKAIRFSLVAENQVMGGIGHSQTIVGADYVRSDAFSIVYDYFLADSNFNAITSPAVTTKNGRTQLSTIYWSIPNGPIEYPYFSPPTPTAVVNGQNVVRGIAQIVDLTQISGSNPLGTTSTGTYEFLRRQDHGIYGVNYTQWFGGKLTTMAGLRLAKVLGVTMQPGAPYNHARTFSPNVNFGVDGQIYGNLRAYGEFSSSYSPPLVLFVDPAGKMPTSSKGTGGEVGLKISNDAQTVSGSISFYKSKSTNEEYQIPSGLQTDINPTGLNGIAGGASSTYVDLTRESSGIQVILTANPSRNWRMRLSASTPAGKIETNVAYPQLYNDQFHENAAGQVTYADGTIVYVNPTYNSKAPFATSATAGAVPLTVSMMNTSTSPYYASPVNPSGAILSTSNVAYILKGAVGTVIDPQQNVHGTILTGATGLPISSMQITPSFALPGLIPIENSGDKTVGYPQISANFTNMYSFSSGMLKGFKIGGSVVTSLKYNMFYYYPNGIATLQKQLFTAPNMTTVNLIAGYAHKFKHVTFSSQVNMNNMFNHYDILILPNQSTGWTLLSSLRATMYGLPRTTTWSNTINF
jgi:outer membrane receptor protein involved in Fe transport